MTDAEHKIRLLMELRSQGITDTRVLAAIERIPQGGRSTYYCPGCQTKPRKGAKQSARRGER